MHRAGAGAGGCAGLAYVYDGSILDRLRADVIEPYRVRGYRRVWLAGISLGGFVAMGYALRHPGQIEGIVALAPYLGRRTLVQEVAAADWPAWRPLWSNWLDRRLLPGTCIA